MGQERRASSRREEDKERDMKIQQAMTIAQDASTRVSIHEVRCEERQGQILKRMERIEWVIVGTAAFLLGCSAIFKLLAG